MAACVPVNVLPDGRSALYGTGCRMIDDWRRSEAVGHSPDRRIPGSKAWAVASSSKDKSVIRVR